MTLQAAGRLEEYPPPQKDIRPRTDRPNDIEPLTGSLSHPVSLNRRVQWIRIQGLPFGPFLRAYRETQIPPEKQRILARIKLG